MSDLPPLEEQDEEWDAWQNVCIEFHSLVGKSPNDSECDPLFKAIALWGERLAALRLRQEPSVVTRAITETALAYEAARTT